MIVEAVETLDGWYSLHLTYQMDWTAWNQVAQPKKQAVVAELIALLTEWEEIEQAKKGSHYVWNVTGHKGDIGFLFYVRN
ncbi:hypothetical protein LLDT2_00110 [Lactococcus lactis subsp. lactis bv. diacetylactis str. TIFN2]|uniref:hypothetical protein n=1 Tax=Lactococcus lactis TaxID=1358 RepID=UPI00038B05EF|nr:hypothetical protein [Lactococcus lactis]EQC93040.1 hypothetical protein LLDT2_00110 [Lactococcus lactis subsp. lactis bv. diacetylactis str. TIFN2]